MRKYKAIYKLLLIPLTILTIGIFSCSDFFNPDIETRLAEENSYKDFLSSRSAVNGLYTQLQDLMTSYIITGELRGDLLKINDRANEDLADIYYLMAKPSNGYLGYRAAYSIIAGCNDVASHLQVLQQQGTTYTDELNNMYAETILLRTWAHFYLYRTYGQTPYIAESFTASGSDKTLLDWISDHTTDFIEAQQLVSDINSVLLLLDPDKTSESEYFNLASAYALLGEIHLWEDEFSEAVSALTLSVEAGKGSRFILDRDLENAKWINIFKGDESATDEIMTKVIFDKGEKQENDLLGLFSAIAPGGSQLEPVESILTSLNGTHRYDGTFKNTNEVGKYTRSLDYPYTSDMPVILYRAADIHLMLAEAFNRLGESDVALQLLNNGSDSLFTAGSKGIRGRIGLPSMNVTGEDENDRMIKIENLIFDERGRELGFEGKRWFDILRIGKRRNDVAFISNTIMNRFENPDSSAIRAYFADSQNWYLPVEQ